MINSKLVESTVAEIEKLVGQNGARAYVLFSGGKDSLTALHLVIEACKKSAKNTVAVHADTTVGIPDNLDYISQICERLRVPLVIVKPKVDYFTLAKKKGLPRFRARWCCGELKVKPLASYFSEVEDEKIVFDGIRGEESKIRSAMTKLSWHKRFSCHIFHPILEWSANDVLNYLSYLGLPQNPLYGKGFRRACECWCGVFKGVNEFKLLRDSYPEFFKKLVQLEASMRNGGSYLFRKGKKIYLRELINESSSNLAAQEVVK